MGPLQLPRIRCGAHAPNFDHLVFLETVIFFKTHTLELLGQRFTEL